MAVSFSIIVPIYNKSKYLRDCIDSILSQSHTDFEIIAVNDGSTDSSLDILNSYEDSRLKTVTVCNGGVSKARNIGIELATKEYVTFVDSDDKLDKDYLESFSKAIELANSDIAIGGLTKVYPDGVHHIVRSTFHIGTIAKKEFLDNFIAQMFINEGILGYVAAKFIHRSILFKHGLRFNPSIKLAEDLDFWSKAYLKANTITIINCNGYQYLQETENSTYELSGQHLSQLIIWTDILKHYTPSTENLCQTTFRKINGIIEAYFLELSKLTLANVKLQLRIMNNYVGYHSENLMMNTGSFLQSQIAKSNVYVVWLYLKCRNFYHKLRK